MPDGLSVYVVDQVTDKGSPVSFSITLHVRDIGGDVSGQFYFFPTLARAEQIQRTATVMAFDIDRAFAAIKGNVVFIEARMQSAMLKQHRDRLFGKRALKLGRDVVRPLDIRLAPF